jgi:tetratricopeptide (TPR) repeat protein
MRTRTAWLASFGVFLLGAVSLADDLVQMKDGRVVDGVPMKVDGDFIVATYKNGEIRLPKSLVADYVIGGSAPEPVTEEAKAQRANGQVWFRGKWMTPVARDKAIKAELKQREVDIAEAKAHSEWRNRYKFESKNFRFESTLTKQQNEYYAALLDAYFEVFKKDWGVSVPKDWGKLKVCIYPDYDSFLKGSGAGRGVAAYYKFVPNPDRELNFYNDRTDPRATETTMFHECNHYLTDLGSNGLRYPMWIGESLAEYYAGSTYDPKTKAVKFGMVQEGRLAEVRADIDAGKKVALLELINGQASYESYTWGWSLFHFLMETPAWQKKFRTFLVDLAKAPDVKRKAWGGGNNFGFTVVEDEECLRVFKKRLGLSDAAAFDKLQSDWYAYIDKLQATNLRGYEEAGKKAYMTQMRLRATRLLKVAVGMGSRDPVTYLCLSRCLRGKPEGLAEALETMKKACEIDPLNADCWAERGFVLQLMGQKDEGKKLVNLAYELEPGGYFVDWDAIAAELSGDGK